MTLLEKAKQKLDCQEDADIEIMSEFCPGVLLDDFELDLCGDNCSKKYNDHPDKCQRCWNQEGDN
jgi:hypothetical protein